MTESEPSSTTRPDPEPARCPQCGSAHDAADRYCRWCGRKLAEANTPAARPGGTAEQPLVAQVVRQQRERHSWVDTRWGIWLLLACLGPLAFPWLWRSRRFSPAGKVLITLLVSVLTVLIVWALYVAILMLVRSLRELFQLMEGL